MRTWHSDPLVVPKVGLADPKEVTRVIAKKVGVAFSVPKIFHSAEVDVPEYAIVSCAPLVPVEQLPFITTSKIHVPAVSASDMPVTLVNEVDVKDCPAEAA